ncbi:hypothetical protein H9P43_005701 [Blastocladiella emersonii ATCC 22665]|nr:hypothetical protein H9P43_005701 [Blastocladiella emersonii ATCC 22665]
MDHRPNAPSEPPSLADLESAIAWVLASPYSPTSAASTSHAADAAGTADRSADDEARLVAGMRAILRVYGEKLYRLPPDGCASLEVYFKSRFNLSRAQVYRLLASAEVIVDLAACPPGVELVVRPFPVRQRVAKAVKDATITPAERQRLWATVLAQLPNPALIKSTDVFNVSHELRGTGTGTGVVEQPQATSPLIESLPVPHDSALSVSLPTLVPYPSPNGPFGGARVVVRTGTPKPWEPFHTAATPRTFVAAVAPAQDQSQLGVAPVQLPPHVSTTTRRQRTRSFHAADSPYTRLASRSPQGFNWLAPPAPPPPPPAPTADEDAIPLTPISPVFHLVNVPATPAAPEPPTPPRYASRPWSPLPAGAAQWNCPLPPISVFTGMADRTRALLASRATPRLT